ncbi:MAG: hypothetical protein K6357_08650 [Elusimicrobiota bacterium]
MTKQLIIKKNITKIFVACPANRITGGPEALHQLVHELTNLGFDAYMFYYDRNKNLDPVAEDYKGYNNKFVEEIEDDYNNILVVPETKTELLYNYYSIQKVIWWLSVDNHFGFLNSKNKLKKMIKSILYYLHIYPRQIYRFSKKEKIIHFVQSEYARQMLKNKSINNIFFLGDYLNNLFIERQINNINTKKEDIVVYNPKKGIEFTKAIIEEAKDIKFVPIENMTRDEVANLLSTAKVYIDFGNHPGKDRIPREAAISGCCVIVGKNGSAKFYEDVPIEDEFKYDLSIKNIPLIIKKIRSCFDNYEEEVKKFAKYREIIKNERAKFIDDIKNIFQVSQ